MEYSYKKQITSLYKIKINFENFMYVNQNKKFSNYIINNISLLQIFNQINIIGRYLSVNYFFFFLIN